MKLVPEIVEFAPELTKWRRDFHAHPEIGFQGVRTSEPVAERLASFRNEVQPVLAGTCRRRSGMLFQENRCQFKISTP